MPRIGKFGLRHAFLILSGICVITAAVASPSIWSVMVALLSFSFTAAFLGIRGDRYCMEFGALGGAFAVLALVIGFWITFLVGYFSYSGARPYFDDGFVFQVIVIPIGYIVIYGPIGALLGAIMGSIVLSFHLARERWSKRRPCNESTLRAESELSKN